ncbi:hypothetical protein [Methylobacterium frigidaeris]|uniref:hypothetical protein n=1 Tax=Methylobacterium frigidaeris TaxID=2038277 RepID=UPI001EDF1437|nr:hypothetical protein [Methylobacterium frigidaeris]
MFLGYLGSLSSGGEHQPTAADVQLDVFDPPEPLPGFEPLSPLDRVADHLMLAHSAAQAARDIVLMQMIEITLFQVGKLLSQHDHATHDGNVH